MSLLLDALKKAALEKQRREQTGAQTNNPAPAAVEKNPSEALNKPELKPDAPQPVVEPVAEQNIASTDSTIAATKIDLGLFTPELEAVARQPDQANTNDLENSVNNPDESLVFDINEMDLNYLEPEAQADSAPDILPGTGIVEEFVLRSSELEAYEGGLNIVSDESVSAAVNESPNLTASVDVKQAPVVSDSSVPQLSPSTMQPDPLPIMSFSKPTPEPAQALPEQVETSPSYTEDIKALFDNNTKPIEAFSASSGKEALAQLLQRSKKAADAARKRMMLMYAFLSVTAILMVVFYYYLLHSDTPNVVAYVPEAPANTEAAATPENSPDVEATEPGASTEPSINTATDAEPESAAGTEEASIATGSLTAATTTGTPRAVDQNSEVAEPKPAARKAPKPAQDPATHYVLPPENVPKQAMIVERNPGVNAVSEAIDRGYKAYQRGDISAAGDAYQEALKQDPYQRDAMLGAAAVAIRQGRQQDALGIYQQRLAREPKDEYAQSGILALSENAVANPELDSELSRLLLDYPEASHLHFLKGSLYAARQQWAAAQVSYFEAWQRDNKNPDLAFNLAVALDHLAQPKEAARFYQQALTLGNTRPASFSVEAIQRRLQDLEGTAP